MNTETKGNPEAESILDDLLDSNMDDVADLPDFVDEMPSGIYKLKVTKAERTAVDMKYEGRDIQAPVVQFGFSIVEAVELKKESERDDVPKEGSYISESVFFHRDVEQAKSVIKKKFEAVGRALEILNIKDLIQQLPDKEILAQVTCRYSKKYDRYFIQVSNAQLC